MEVKSVQGVYEGSFDAAGKKITGTWQQGSQSLPLTLERNQGTVVAAEIEKLSPADLVANKLVTAHEQLLALQARWKKEKDLVDRLLAKYR